jgi:hypothetical protein
MVNAQTMQYIFISKKYFNLNLQRKSQERKFGYEGIKAGLKTGYR